MPVADTETMNRLEAAQSRLEAALARLEAALARASAPESDLAVELERARQEYAALKGLTDRVAGRLDRTIERLRRLLGEAAE